ncbi:MAG TPA: hypothetical protein VFU45_08350, partial [Gemmatimonadales bacterium]|nr:hypothetical protein [Gemmatimonadales bacterium]
STGFCNQASVIGFGASVDYRLDRSWRLQTSFEPTYQSCTRGYNQWKPSTAYQVGFDALWDREF